MLNLNLLSLGTVALVSSLSTGVHSLSLPQNGLSPALSATALSLGSTLQIEATTAVSNSSTLPSGIDLLTATVKELGQFLANGTITSVELTRAYLSRIERDNHQGLNLRAVIETGPTVLAVASALDLERKEKGSRGPFHGIPILLKDNIATDVELEMNTTAGSFALLGSTVPRDAFIAARLRAAGAIIIGKASLSEWANFRGNITNGWSARGGQTSSAYVVGGFANGGDPCGSSSGSGVAVSAGWSAIAIGTETDGSIVCPSNRAALYGLKPTVGLTSRAGIVPISHTQDSPGPMGKSTWDVATMLGVIAGFDPRDNATEASLKHNVTDYTTAIIKDGFKGLRIGVPRRGFYNSSITGLEAEVYNTTDFVLKKIASLGAHVQDPANLETVDDLFQSTAETTILNFDFKVDLATYLAELGNTTTTSLKDIINFNDKFASLEMPVGECCQEIFLDSLETTGFKAPEYQQALANDTRLGIDSLNALFDKYHLDVIAIPTEGGASTIAAISQAPIATVPIGYYGEGSGKVGQPYGLAFIARRFEERKLIRVMAAFEEHFPARRVPSQLK